jgi:YVTN family beta-propeller protein
MKTFVAAVLGLVVALGASMVQAQQGTVDLLEGDELDHWYSWLENRGKDVDPKGVYSKTDGILRISGEENGHLITHEEYGDYHLLVEYKWGDETFAPRIDKARDSGLMIHSFGTDGDYKGFLMNGLIVQLIEGGSGDLLVLGDGTESFSITCPVAAEKQGGSYLFSPDGELTTITGGRINWFGRDPEWKEVKDFRGANDIEKPVGEWNRLEVIADGGKITVLLNGIVVNRAVDCNPKRGRIQIQCEGAEVFYRKFDLTPLDRDKITSVDAGRQKRFIFNSDGGNMFIDKPYPMQPEDVYSYVDELLGTGITSLHISSHVGMDMNFQGEHADIFASHLTPEEAETLKDRAASKKGSTLGRGAANILGLHDAGHDPLGLVIDRAQDQGLETFVSFRLNEVHWVEKPANMLLSKFWLEHPEWRVAKIGDEVPQIYLDILGPRTSPVVASWLPGGLNFAIPEVQDRKLAQLREICERYPIEGIELDFQRFPVYFPFGKEKENIETMNQWMRKVHAMTQEVGLERGKPVLLTARVMATPAQNLGIGLDPMTWAKEGLLDSVIISHYLHNNHPLPVKEFRALFPDTLPLYASIEVEKDSDTYRQIAKQLWRDGIDGIMMFNFFTRRESGVEPDFSVLPEVGGPASRVQKPMLIVANKHSDTLSFIDHNTNEVEQTITVGHNPHEMTITPDQRFMYLSNYAAPGNTISVVDLHARKHIKQINTGAHTRIHGATMAPDGKHAYFTAGQTGWIVEVDTATHEMTRAIPTHGKISHMVLVSLDNKRLYAANITSKNVSVIDRKSGELIMQIPCEEGAEGMAFTPDGKHLWVANQSGESMSIIDLATHKVIERFDIAGMPVRIRFTRDGKRAYIPSWTPEGELIVLDVASRKEIKRIKVGGNAIGVELTPDEKFAFVGCEYTDGLHVIDTATLKVVDIIDTGDGPDPMSMWFPKEAE